MGLPTACSLTGETTTTLTLPRYPDIGVLALVYHEWSLHWMIPHQVLTNLARYFHVVWVNPARGWREVLRNKKPAHLSETDLPPGFNVYTPEFWLPELYRPVWLANCTFDQRLKRARRLLVDRGCKKIILYLWFPQFERALSSIPFDLSCYHMDDEYSFSTVELPLNEAEVRVIQAVDEVFITSPGLLEKKGSINLHTTFTPSGVDYEAYATPTTEPSDIQPIPHPRIGYTGVLKKQLDWPLLLDLTRRHPEWSFVFVGPQAPHGEIKSAIQELSGRRNVYFLGAKSTHDLAAYPQHFDVCIMPYHANDYTKYINPLKLNEYLASGRPTVGTAIRTLVEVANVVSLVRTPEEWSAAITDALRPSANTTERRMERQKLARRHDWRLLVGEIAKTLGRRLSWEIAESIEQELGAIRDR